MTKPWQTNFFQFVKVFLWYMLYFVEQWYIMEIFILEFGRYNICENICIKKHGLKIQF